MNMQDSHDFVYMYVNICVLQFLFMSCKNNQQTKFIGWQVCMPRHITRTLCHICSQNGHVLKEEHLPGSSQEVTFILSYRTIAFDDSTIYSSFWYLGFFRPFTSSLAYSYPLQYILYGRENQCTTSQGANGSSPLCALVFSASYHTHKGIIIAYSGKMGGAPAWQWSTKT